ncbi:unnamed protein product [Effrenium voratum]|nr:unnamed protein product [Effrenium voratum]
MVKLELRHQEATAECQGRLAEEVQRALEVGRCAVELSANMRRYDAESLELCLLKAEKLEMEGLEKVRSKLSTLRLKRNGRSSPENQKDGAEEAAPRRVDGLENESDSYGNQARSTNLIFIDLETSCGFYEFDQEPQILEVAIIITDKDLKPLAQGHWVLGGFTKPDLEKLPQWHQENFRDAEPGGAFPPQQQGGNGLFSAMLTSRFTLDVVEAEIMSLVEKHCPAGECPLAGYSVQCDREVLKLQMPRLYRHVHHQILDVAGFFTAANLWIPEHSQYWARRSSAYNHRALQDVRDSIAALRWIREKFFDPQKFYEPQGQRRL